MNPSLLTIEPATASLSTGSARRLRVRVPAGAVELDAQASPEAVRELVDRRLDRLPPMTEVARDEAVDALLRVQTDLRNGGILTTGIVCGLDENGRGVFWTYHVGLLALPRTEPFDAAGLLTRVAAAELPAVAVEGWSAGGRPAVGLRARVAQQLAPPRGVGDPGDDRGLARVSGEVLLAVAASLVVPPGEDSGIFISGASLDASQLDRLSAMIALMAMSAHFQDEASDDGASR